MTMMISIKDKYLKQLETFVNSLPKDAIQLKSSLDEELDNRIDSYNNNKLLTMPFDARLDSLRSKFSSQD